MKDQNSSKPRHFGFQLENCDVVSITFDGSAAGSGTTANLLGISTVYAARASPLLMLTATGLLWDRKPVCLNWFKVITGSTSLLTYKGWLPQPQCRESSPVLPIL
ncbi:hypothetical protein M5G07_04985 [Serratia symbiotica]|nr:hypothetical protein [Serratia symbiotica]